MTAASLDDVCGVSGLGIGDIYNACNFFHPSATGGKTPQFQQLTKGTAGYHTDWNNLAPNIGVAWRPNVESGLLRTLLGDPDQATMRGGYSVAYERQGLGVFTRHLRSEPWQHAQPDPRSQYGPRRPGRNRGRCCCASRTGCTTRRSRRRRHSRSRSGRTAPTTSRRSIRISRSHRREHARSACSDRSRTEHGPRGPLRRHARHQSVVRAQLQRAEHHRERLPRRIQAGDGEPAGEQRRRRGQPSRILRVLRAGHRHESAADLSRPISTASRDATNPAAYTGGANNVDELDARRPSGSHEPESEFRQRHDRERQRRDVANANAAGDLDGNLTRPQNALAAGLPANFFVVNPHANQVNIYRQRRVQQLSRAAARSAAAAVEGTAGERQLPVRARRGLVVSRVPLRPREQSDQRIGAPRDQDAVGLDAARSAAASGSARTRIRSSTASSAAGSSTASAASRRARRTSATSASSA